MVDPVSLRDYNTAEDFDIFDFFAMVPDLIPPKTKDELTDFGSRIEKIHPEFPDVGPYFRALHNSIIEHIQQEWLIL